MDVKMNAIGDLLCYIVLSADDDFEVEEEFRRIIIPELIDAEISLLTLGPRFPK